MNLSNADYGFQSAAQLRHLLTTGAASASSILGASLARVETFNPVLKAICTLNPAAHDEARAVDQRLAAGHAPRALEGVPFVAKDNMETAGLRTTFGTPFRPFTHSSSTGRSNMSERPADR